VTALLGGEMLQSSGHTHAIRRTAGWALLACCIGLGLDIALAQQQAPTPGANVNVISGIGPDGDWTLQRQNEPTMACSSRNPRNCLAGANDYRTVDIPFPNVGEKVTGDAWLGWYTTKDAGQTWRTRLLPGYPQDVSQAGLASPLRGYPAGADPVVRAGTNGLFYYGGLVFDREEGGGSAIFVARFIDNNNQEGNAGEPIAYLGASIVHRIGAAPLVARRGARPPTSIARRTSRPRNQTASVRAGAEQTGINDQLVDKPWIAVDVPRAGAQTCSVGGGASGVPLQTFPGGRVYMAYALFDGPDEQRGRIMYSRSLDCGASWSPPRAISRVQSADVNDDGVATTADVTRLQASYGRSCGHVAYNPNADINNDCIVNVFDLNYVSRGVGRPVPSQPRLSQGATLAVDPQSGALQIAWRQFNDGVLPDAIVTVRSTDGTAFSSPAMLASILPFDQGTTDTSFRTNAFPTLAIDGAGRSYLAWSARGYANVRPVATEDDARIVISTSLSGGAWSTPVVVDNQTPPGHQIMPALTFAQGKLQMVYYDLREDISQLYGPFVDELPILTGPPPRIRHTIEVRAAQSDPGAQPAFQSFRLTQYQTGSLPGSQTVRQLAFNPPNLPLFRAGSSPFLGDYVDAAAASAFHRIGQTWSFNTAPSGDAAFHAIWTDNRDVRPPANGDWTAYTAPNPPFPRPSTSSFDPTQPIGACVAGQAGMRNQNIYTARITQGLLVGALTNARQLGAIQRSFPVFAQNNSPVVRSYRLTIANQPPGGQASFQQFQPLTSLDVQVPPKSTIARTVFVSSSDPRAQVAVAVVEISAPSGAPVPNGQQGTIILNPDPTNPDIANPDIANPDIANPDIANPDIANAEVYNPDIANAAVRNPDIANPDIANPDIANPDIANVTIVNPDIANPDIANPDIANPDIANPDIANPDIANPDIANGSLSDTTWFLRNTGNAGGSFTVKLAINTPVPTGFKTQLIAHKVYKTPVVQGCELLTQPQTVLLANIPNPTFVTGGIANPDIANPDIANPDIANLTVALSPGETARITLRVLDPDRTDAITFSAVNSVTPAAVAQAVNTAEAQLGVTQPTVAAPLTSDAPVPGSTVGGTYTTTLPSNGPGTWMVAGGALPPGLTLDPTTGVITGTPTSGGTFSFTARFRSTTGLTDYRTVTITIGAVGDAADVTLSDLTSDQAVTLGDTLVYTLSVSNAGPAAATSVVLTDTLPAGVAFVSATATQGSCTHSNGTVICQIGTLASGSSATIAISVRPTIVGTHTNQARVSVGQADPIASNNTTQRAATVVGAPSGFLVSNTNDAGPGSLRQAILSANATPGADVISFGIPGTDLHTITPATPLPIITETVTIDGWTQPGYDGRPLIELDGSNAGTASGLVINADGTTVRGIVVNRFAQSGIVLQGSGNVLHGNFIGTDASGTDALANGADGVTVRGTGNTIGGTAAGTGNLISGNGGDGVNIDAGAANNIVQGNRIGTNADGTAAIGNGFQGVFIAGGAASNTIGGTVPGARNLVSGNGSTGVMIHGPATTANTVAGNFIGTNAAGTGALGNVFDGVSFLQGATGNTVGGTAAGAPNLISGNRFGVASFGAGSAGNFVVSNFIGTDAAGTGPIGNAVGVFLQTGGNTIGNTAIGGGNTIAFNQSVGVRVDSGLGNAILSNSIHSNGSLGIDLAPLGVTPNDSGDVDAGANNLLNHPVLSSARTVGPNVLVQVALSPTPSGPFLVHFYANQSCDPSGSGEGASLLGVSSFGPNEGGDTNFEATFSAGAVPPGSFITATATDSGNNSSEFSPCALVAPDAGAANLAISKTDSPDPVTVGSSLTYLLSVSNSGPDAATNVTVTDVLPASVTLVSASPSAGSCTGTTTISCVLGTVASGATVTVGIVVTPTAAGEITNSASVTAAGTDPDSANNSATATTTVTSASSSFIVANTNDSGEGSLRQAILNANASPGADTISFAIPGAGLRSISSMGLPTITEPVTIDGTTQSGFVPGTPIVELNGAEAPAGANGIVITSGNSVVRGLIINRFPGNGIVLQGGNGNVITGNWLGTSADGSAAAGSFNGILIMSSGHTVGGTTAAERNVISGNTIGIQIGSPSARGNVILGNLIGTDHTGTLDVGNLQAGVLVFGEANSIGGPGAGARNVISGNDQAGVRLALGASANTVEGNFIGTDISGANQLPNLVGVSVGVNGESTASSNRIGGLTAGAGNLIAFNTAAGIQVPPGSTNNAIWRNSIHANGGLGIDLNADGVTANDGGDGDGGANDLQNFPVLTAVSGGVEGTLNSTPSGTFRVEIFGSPACDASGSGEGATFLTSLVVETNTDGNATIPFLAVADNQHVTATATDGSNNTSEFAACVQVGATPALADVSPASAQQGAILDVALTGANTSFVNGATVVSFGAGISVNSVTVSSPTAATANVTIGPTAFTGSRTVTVTTGTEIVTSAFTVTAGTASLSSVNPGSGQQGQSNLDITVTGDNTHFAPNVTTASFGSGVVVNLVTVTSATSAVVNITLQDFAASGPRTVTLTTGGENASLVNGYNVVAGTPRLTLVSPASGQQGQTLSVAVSGQFTNFVNGTTTADFGPGITVNSVNVTSAAAATVNITVSALAAIGSRTVTLTTGSELASSLDTGSFFTVTAGSAAIAQVSPASGRQAESLGLTVTGTNTHFASGTTSFSLGTGMTVTSALINSPTSAALQITISQSAPLGPRTVTATTAGEVATLADGFSVTAGSPSITTVSPTTGRQAETLNLSITGQFTSFVSGTTAASLGSGITVNSVAVIDATHATVNVTVSPGAALGSRTVAMTTGAEIAQQVGGFTVTPGQPTLFSVNPSSAVQGTNATIILNGAFTNFTAGVTTAFFGSGISAGTVTVNGPTLASVPVAVFADALAGPRSVTVTTGSESVTLVNGFTVLQGMAAITSINPNAGQRGLTRDVSLTGVFTNWQLAVTAVTYGDGITVNSNQVTSPTTITTNITIDAEATLGPRDVAISTGSEVLTVPGGFVVNDTDVTAPVLLTTSPQSGTAGVPLNTAVTVELSEPLDRSTVTASSFQLYDSFTGQYITGTLSVDATGRVATFVPSQLLAVSRQHLVFLNSPITDVAGNTLGNQFFTFTTGFATDTTGPTLRLANPQNGDTAVARNAAVVLQFDRPINAATLGVGVRLRAAGVSVPGTYAMEDGQKRVRFTPASQLAASTGYTVTLTAELRDIAGNALTNPGALVFTTGVENDTTVPTVTTYTPYHGEVGVGRLPVIRVMFSEAINPISLNATAFYIYNYLTGALIRSTITVAPDRRSATLIPDGPLEPYSVYYYFLSPFLDIAGNAASLGTIVFGTGASVDTVPPTVVSLEPPSGATNVPVNAQVRVMLSEAIDATSLGASAIQLSPSVAGALALSPDRLSLLFTPGANLVVSTTYTVQVSGLRDSSGNTMSPVSSSFTTAASSTADTTAPTVVSFSPASAATNVPVSSPIVMTVSEPIRASGLAGSMRVFANTPLYGFVQIAGAHSVDPTGTAITFTPIVPYPGNTQLWVYSNYDSSTTDFAGNPLQFTTTTFTTASDADTIAPVVVMVTPSEGATGIGPQAVVTLTFSEPLLPSTVTNDTFTLFDGSIELGPAITRSADNTTVFLTTTLQFNSTITVFATGDVTDVSGNALADFSSTFTTGSTTELNRPQIVTQRPTGPGIPADASITLFVNEPLNESTAAGAVYVSQNGVLVEGEVTLSGGGTAIHFDPAGNFAPGATVQVFVTGDARDTFGNSLFDYNGSFTVAPDTTTQAPTTVRSSPGFFSAGNPTNTVIDIEFSEPLSPATVTAANLFVMDAANQPVAGTLSLRNGDRIVRFMPAAPFAANNYNYVYLTNGLRDLQNTPFAATNFYFYTGAGADATAPAVISIAPPDGALDIGINAIVRLQLSEPINPLTVSAGTVSLSSSSGPVPASVTFNPADTTVTLAPQVPLPVSTALTLTIDGVQDAAGNPVPAQTTQFTTNAGADTVRPTVIATNVTAYGANNVPINTVFHVTFDEPMDVATVLAQTATFLYDSSLGYRSGTGSMSSDGRTFTFVPDNPLAVNHSHSLSLSTGFDLAGNQQNAFTFFFTTTFASDTTPPVVSGVNPVPGATGMPRNARVEIRFSEPVSELSLSNVQLLTNGGTPVSVTRALSDTNRLLTLRPNGLLSGNRTYTISVGGVRDTSNNVMAAPFTSTFATSSRTDLIAPTVIATNPSAEDRGVGINVVARLTFSEPIDPLSVSAENFLLGNASGGAFLDATVLIAADRRSVALTPNAALLPYTRYYVQLNGFADVAGNPGGGAFVAFYTGGGFDTSPPAVVSLSPPNGTAGLPVNVRLAAVMSEAIDVTSVSNGAIHLTPAAAGTVSLAADRITLTFVPSANLAPSTVYSVQISGLRDASGNTMAPAAFGFTTGASATADTTPPVIVSRSPANGAAGIGVTSTLTFTTSERITAAAVGPASVPVFAALSGVGTFQLAGQYAVDATGTIVTFTVTGAFPANATIQWYTNNNGLVRDMAGLPLPSEFAQFTTANTPDVSGPAVQTVTPTDGATGVGPYAVVTLTFSESVNPITVNPETVALFDGPTRLSPGITQSIDNRMVFLTTTLPADSTITILATSGIRDLSGNALAAFSSTFATAPAYDFNRPFVVTQRPTGSGVARTTPVTLFLNRPVDPATVSAALFISQNGVLVTGTVSLDGSNQAITFTPTVPFAALASIEVVLTTAARDFAGNTVNPHYGSFTIENDPAAAAPSLTRTTPGQFSNGNPTNTIIDLEFSEPLNPATIIADHVFVRDAANSLVPGTLSLRSGNRVVRFTASAPFAPNNYNYVFYTAGLLDLQGAAVAASNFYFYTGADPDSTQPSVISVVPTAGTTGVGINGSIRIAFSEAVNPLTITSETVVVAAGAPLGTTFQIGSGNTLLTVVPQRPLPPNTLITVTISGVEDPSGHVAATGVTSFTTGSAPDTTAPAMIASNILYGDPNVPVNTVFEWAYSEPIDASTVIGQQNVLYDHTLGYVPDGTLSVSPDGRRVTFVPPANLAPGRSHQVALGHVADLSGNVGGAFFVFFTTSTASDTAAPQVIAVTPPGGTTGVPLNARLRVAFDEAVSAASLEDIRVLVSGTPLVVASRTLSDGERTVTLTLNGLLAGNTSHTISVEGVRDRAGNALTAPVTSTFTTGPGVDLVPPANTVVTTPAANASGVAVGTAPTVTFSEAMDPTSVMYAGASGVSLVVAATGQLVPVAYALSSDLRTITLTPASPLANGTQYRIQVSTAISDLAGNAFPGFLQFLFTTQP